MIVYLGMLSLILFTAISLKSLKLSAEKYNKIFLLLSFVLLFLISSLRAKQIGTDTANYINKFNLIQVTDFRYIFDLVRYEKGYVILNKIVSYISSNQQSIIVATSFIVLYTIFSGINKNSVNKVLSVYLFITLYYYFISFNAIRQYLAIGLIIFAYQYVKKREFFRFFIFVLLATTFHQLAIIFLPIYFFYGMKLNNKKVFFIVFSFTLVLIGFDAILNFVFLLFPQYEYYKGTDYLEGGGMLTSLISGSILFFGFFVRATNKLDEEYDFLLLIILFSFLTSLISMKVILFNRFNYYFEIFNILFIPKAVSLEKNQKVRLVYYILICSITLIYYVVRLIEGWHRVTPYSIFIQ